MLPKHRSQLIKVCGKTDETSSKQAAISATSESEIRGTGEKQ
jgi:hypothetical protein